MESLGELLKSARKEKDLSIDQISRETNISIRYLEALEMENFSIFPGEPYIIGFLRNYGKYLELDVQKVISLYRTLRIQEQPIPVEQLLKPQRNLPRFLIPSLVIMIFLGLAGWGIFHLVVFIKNRPSENIPEQHIPVVYTMEGNSKHQRLRINDTINVMVDNVLYKLELINLGEVVTISTPQQEKPVILDLSQPKADIDLNNDGVNEFSITVTDFVKNNADIGVELYFQLMDTAAVFDSQSAQVTSSGSNVTAPVTASSVTIIPSSPSAYPFTLQSSFQGYCMFRWEIIGEQDRRGRNQRYFQRSDPDLSIQAQNGIRIWASNAQAAKMQVIGGGRTIPVELGGAGEVVVAEVRWVVDEDRRYRLMLIRLENNT